MTRDLPNEEITRLTGIPVTSVARTLLDLAGMLSFTQLQRAVEQAERLEVLDAGALRRTCDHSRGRSGVQTLRALLAEQDDPPPPTRSELERRFLDLCSAAELPAPSLNVCVAGYEVDAVWHQNRLIVELDGYAYHRDRASFERDRARDATLQLAGYRVLRVTHRRLETEPAAVANAVRALLDPG